MNVNVGKECNIARKRGINKWRSRWYSICAKHYESNRTTRIAINFRLAATR